MPHFGKKGVCWSCGKPKNANSGCESPLHKKTVAVNSNSVRPLLSVGNTDLFENTTVCRVDVARHSDGNVISSESYQLQKPDNGVKSETHSDTLHVVLVDADLTNLFNLRS